jgi:hypothetical protein
VKHRGLEHELKAEDFFAQCAFPALLASDSKEEMSPSFKIANWELSQPPEHCKTVKLDTDTAKHVQTLHDDFAKEKSDILKWFEKPSEDTVKEFFSHEETPTPPSSSSSSSSSSPKVESIINRESEMISSRFQQEELPYNLAWPDRIIPYAFDPLCTKTDKFFIWTAMMILRARTNVGFVLVPRTRAGHKVLIQHGTAGANAEAGFGLRFPGSHAANEKNYVGVATEQTLNGGVPATGAIFTAVHELVHAVGMGHMNQRTDAHLCLNGATYGNLVYRAAWTPEPVNCDPANPWFPPSS